MTNQKKSKSVVNVGEDVGKFSLDVYIHEKGLYWQVENNGQGIQQLVKRLAHYQVERLVMEATGRYEFLLAEAAHHKGLPVCIVKPLSVRRYAGAINQTAKTDKIDAALIARFGADVKPNMTPKKSKNLIAIKDLIARRRQLMGLRTQELNRIKIMGQAFEVSCRRMIRVFDQEIARMEKRLQKHVDDQAEWTEKQQILKSAPGVGDTGTTRFSHDGAGNRTQLMDAKGQVFTYHYDALNRLTFFDARGTADDVSYTYKCPDALQQPLILKCPVRQVNRHRFARHLSAIHDGNQRGAVRNRC